MVEFDLDEHAVLLGLLDAPGSIHKESLILAEPVTCGRRKAALAPVRDQVRAASCGLEIRCKSVRELTLLALRLAQHRCCPQNRPVLPRVGVDPDISRLNGLVEKARVFVVVVSVAIEDASALNPLPFLSVIADLDFVRPHETPAVPAALSQYALHLLLPPEIHLQPLLAIAVSWPPTIATIQEWVRIVVSPCTVIHARSPETHQGGRLGDGAHACFLLACQRAAHFISHICISQGLAPNLKPLNVASRRLRRLTPEEDHVTFLKLESAAGRGFP